MRFDYVDRALTRIFYKLGVNVARNPYYYLIIPFAIAAFLLTGFQRLNYEDDPEFLFSPTDGEAKKERTIVESNYHFNYSEFNPGRMTKPGKLGRIIVTPNNGSSVLRKEIFDDLKELDEIVKSIKITYDEDDYTYKDLCANWHGDCQENDILEFSDYSWDSDYKLSFPYETHFYSRKVIFLPGSFGGIQQSGDKMEDAQAVSMQWFLKAGTPKEKRIGSLWEAEFLKKIGALTLPNIKVCMFVSDTIEKELEKNSFGILPYMTISIMTMTVFTFLALSMSDCVKSKPSLGCLGVFSAMLGTGAAFGLLSYIGLEFITINMAAPFLMLGIGMDDTFVMLASWRKTKIQDPVEKRMGAMFSDAAVSITITSLTDMLSFWIGVVTPFPCVRIFCIYTALAVLFTFIYHITFFAACIVLTGRLESKNRHGAFWCITATPKSLAENRSWFYKLFCTGGIDSKDPWNPKDNKDHQMMVFFRDGVGRLLSLTPVKIIVLFIFMAYLAIAIWSCTKLKEGLQLRRLSDAGSYSIDFYDAEDKYLREYSYRLQIIIDEPLDYSDINVQKDVEDLVQSFENSSFIADSKMSEMWLREFLKIRQDYYQITVNETQAEFISQLRGMFLDTLTGRPFKNDVEYADNFTSIRSSRFVVQSKDIWNTKLESEMLKEIRSICKSSKFRVYPFHPYFIFMDQYLLVREVTIQAVVVAAIVMTIISLIFIPSPLCAFWVGFSIVSIEIGVIGYMALWDVYLDGISMINLIMCIGFSVDFSAHVSYAYISSKETDPNERMKDALYSLGMPILLGALSTFLSVAFLLFSSSYIFITFFKTVFLVIFFGATHGLFLLPVMLSLIGPGSCSGSKAMKKTQPIVVSISEKSNVAIIDVKTMTIPRPKTNSSVVTNKTSLADSSPDSSNKLSQDLDRDLGLGTSAEESSNDSNGKGSDVGDANTSLEVKEESFEESIKEHRGFPEALKYVYDNVGYSSDEEIVFPSRKNTAGSAHWDIPSSRRNRYQVNSAENRNVMNNAWSGKGQRKSS